MGKIKMAEIINQEVELQNLLNKSNSG